MVATRMPSGVGSRNSAASMFAQATFFVRQVGNKFHRRSQNVGQGNDYTLFALVEGNVMFDRKGRRINVVPIAN